MNKTKNLLKNEQGSVLIWFIIMLPIILICAGLVVDGARYIEAQARLTTIVNASSRAGASTATIVVDDAENSVTVDIDGIKDQQVVKRKHVEITDPQRAYDEAFKVAQLNGATEEYWSSQMGQLVAFTGKPVGKDQYETYAEIRLKPGFLYPVMKAATGREYVIVSARSRSQAVEPKN